MTTKETFMILQTYKFKILFVVKKLVLRLVLKISEKSDLDLVWGIQFELIRI